MSLLFTFQRALFERATFLIKVSWINWRIDPAEACGTSVREGGIYAGSVTVDLTDLVIEARAILGPAHSAELKIGQDLSVNDRAGEVQRRCHHLLQAGEGTVIDKFFYRVGMSVNLCHDTLEKNKFSSL